MNLINTSHSCFFGKITLIGPFSKEKQDFLIVEVLFFAICRVGRM